MKKGVFKVVTVLEILSLVFGISQENAGLFFDKVSGGEQVSGDAILVRETITQTASDGNVLIGVKGIDMTDPMSDVLNELNQVRYEACSEGVIDPATGKALTLSDYKPLKIGKTCTEVSKIRAAEGAVYLGHARPTGNGNISSCFEVASYCFEKAGINYMAIAENLGWTYEDNTYISGWISEKDDYVSGNTSAQVGHYEAIISTDYNYVGISTFDPVDDIVNYDWACTEATFAKNDVELENLEGKQNSTVIAKMEVPLTDVISCDINGDAVLCADDETELSMKASIDNKISGSRHNCVYDCPVYDKVTWESLDESVLKISDNNALGIMPGRTTIKSTIGEGEGAITISRDVLIAPIGTTVTGAKNPDMITVESYERPVLPSSVLLSFSNGESIYVDVIWDSYDTSELATNLKSNEFDVNGIAYGYEVVQRIHVNAANVIGIRFDDDTYSKSFETDYGTRPDYPKKCFVELSNGLEYTDVPITWGELAENCYKIKESKTYTVIGHTPSYFQTDEGYVSMEVNVTVTVNYDPELDPDLSTDDDNTEKTDDKIDGKVNETLVQTDEEGNLIKITDSDGNIIEITDSDGNIIKTTDSYGNVVSEGIKIKDKKYIYKVVKVGNRDGSIIGNLVVTGLKKKSLKQIKIATRVNINGITYNVVGIDNKAFKNNNRIVKVTIGKNVKTIGENAFAGCKKLKRVVINSKNLLKVNNKAFYRKTGKKITFKVPKEKKKKYKKLLKKAGTNKYVVK